MYYVTQGNVILVHKETQTYIKEISIDSFLGEVAFFSGGVRSVSATSKNITVMLTIDREDFFNILKDH